MNRLRGLLAIGLALMTAGCIAPQKMELNEIELYSGEVGNLIKIGNGTLGPNTPVHFYIEVRNFQSQKVDNVHEFWLTMDIVITDWNGTVYLEKINENEIHITNATEKPGMVFYRFPWHTANLVLSGEYQVTIIVKDKLSGRIEERSKDFSVVLT
jgi:hypothetical protein